MQKVVTAAEMREVDRLTTEKYGIPSILLMENAAHAAARVITEKLGGSVRDRSVLILCGKGNNGGDGAALARILWQQGADVEVCLFGIVKDTKDHARTNFEILRKIADQENFEIDQTDLAFEEITSLEEWLEYDSLNFHCDDPDVVVDALVGTGLKRSLEGVYAEAAAFIAALATDNFERKPLIVSLDLPSGLNSDSGEVIGINAKAHLTVTFSAPKPANALPPASNFNGDTYVEKIGSPCELINGTKSQLFIAERGDACGWLCKTQYSSDSYKNIRGHTLLLAGSKDYSGAAVLCGNAAIQTGVGLVTLAVPESSLMSVASRVLPEVMVCGIAETGDGGIAVDAFDEIGNLLEKADSVAIGCGLAQNESTKEFVKKIVGGRRQPVIVDADALNLLSPFGDVAAKNECDIPLILTPHGGEFMRLIGTENKDVIKDRVAAAREFSQKHNVILVLKGERVLIGEPSGKVVINPTGNAGLGKAGNGDTLTGIIVGFAAQAMKMNVDMFETVVAAVYLAGLAGDIAEKKYGKRVMTASDVRECLVEAFQAVSE